MISITAQNKYFDALHTMVNTGANDSKIDRLYDEMIAEFQTSEIGLNNDAQDQLFAKLNRRFQKFTGVRIARRQLAKFERDKSFLKRCLTIKETIEQKNHSWDNGVANNNVGIERSFTLLDNVLTTDCFNTLKNHKFINSDTKKMDFEKIFKGEEVINKIDWIGTLTELARFIYLLHTNYEKHENKAVCETISNKYLITSKCFMHNGKEINPVTLENNNRELSATTRYTFLLKAIKHLQSPKRTTS